MGQKGKLIGSAFPLFFRQERDIANLNDIHGIGLPVPPCTIFWQFIVEIRYTATQWTNLIRYQIDGQLRI